MMPLPPTLEDILRAGVLAPSADNHHRLRFEPVAEGVLLWSAAGRLTALSGYQRTLDLVSLGAVIENIALRAGAHRLAAAIEIFPDGPGDLVAWIGFQTAPCKTDPLDAAIALRHSNRRFFKGPPLNAAALQGIADVAAQLPAVALDWFDRAEQRRALLPLIRLAEGERFRSRTLHAEMFSNIRFDLGWRRTCAEALPPGSLEVEAPLRAFFRLLRHWPVMRVANLLGAHRQLGWRAGDLPCRLAPHLGVISVPSLADGNQVDAGRAFERAWLAITNLGLSVQAMPASALYAQDGATEQGVPESLQHRLRAGWDQLLPGRTPLMVFRMGRAKAPSLVTGRPPLENFLSI